VRRKGFQQWNPFFVADKLPQANRDGFNWAAASGPVKPNDLARDTFPGFGRV
jgi:hypothetical protein